MKFSAYQAFGLIFYVAVAHAAPEASVPATGMTLKECYVRALAQSETLAIDEQELRIIETRYRQAFATILPEISWKYTNTIQDTPPSIETSSSSVQGTLLRRTRPESYFEVRQPLFSGFREAQAMKVASSAGVAQRLQIARARQTLLEDVAVAFYTALTYQRDVEMRQGILKLLEDRISELGRRFRLGKSRRSESLSAESRLATYRADLEDSRQALAVAMEALSFLTGLAPETRLEETAPLPALPPLEQLLPRLSARPDVMALDEARVQAGYMVKYAQGAHWPSADVVGRYFTERVGFNKEVDWDIVFGVTVPLFSGFATQAAVNQARAEQITAALTVARARRLAIQEIRTVYRRLESFLKQWEALRTALKLDDDNYKQQQREYTFGLVNNLEVLQALEDLQDMHRRTLQVEAAVRVNAVQLRVASGEGL